MAAARSGIVTTYESRTRRSFHNTLPLVIVIALEHAVGFKRFEHPLPSLSSATSRINITRLPSAICLAEHPFDKHTNVLTQRKDLTS